jgi:murein DD-endopeptidase MepM/ murein hydrolase activator NlpD
MTPRRRARGWAAAALFVCFCGGVVAGWFLRGGAPTPAQGNSIVDTGAPSTASTAGAPHDARPAAPPAVSGSGRTEDIRTQAPIATTGAANEPPIAALHQHDLRMPIDGATVESMKGGFDERRDAGGRPHEAVDMLAPRNTPVHAVEDGTIAKLFVSKAGGNTIYQFDPSGRFCYYYAHLERYADGLRDGAAVARGDVIGFVGTSGNAPANTPHLHFAIFELTPERHWWEGKPLDPYLAFQR